MVKLLFALLVILTFTACQEEQNENLEKESFQIMNVWMRPGIENRNSATFMQIINGTDTADTLFSAESDLAKLVEIHETYTHSDEMKGMRQVDRIIIPANSKVDLKPGGYHIMLIGLNKDLNIGETDSISITLSQNGKIILPVKVQ